MVVVGMLCVLLSFCPFRSVSMSSLSLKRRRSFSWLLLFFLIFGNMWWCDVLLLGLFVVNEWSFPTNKVNGVLRPLFLEKHNFYFNFVSRKRQEMQDLSVVRKGKNISTNNLNDEIYGSDFLFRWRCSSFALDWYG